jgi:hypothetical protein
MGNFRTSAGNRHEFPSGKHRFEHWYRDNSVYFITSSTRSHAPCFQIEQAKLVFWDRFDHWTDAHGFETWVATLMTTHYHVVGYMPDASQFGEMMRKIHGSVAKLVNDLLPTRHRPFWRDRGGMDYFDGCLRDMKQLRRTYQYVLRQSIRHGICHDWRKYRHTRVYVPLTRCVETATRLRVFLPDVPYARYDRSRAKKPPRAH